MPLKPVGEDMMAMPVSPGDKPPLDTHDITDLYFGFNTEHRHSWADLRQMKAVVTHRNNVPEGEYDPLAFARFWGLYAPFIGVRKAHRALGIDRTER